jgi:DNA topoisomerase-2
MYVGSTKAHTAESYLVRDGKMMRGNLTWNPAILKFFDEVISNSVDHAQRPEGKHLNTIKVELTQDGSKISVWDNGGIPVKEHPEYNEYIPTVIFGSLRSGSNFDDTDDTTLTGQNGLGATLVNVFSTKFTVETSDGKARFKQTWQDNMHKVNKPSIIEQDEAGFTRVTYELDYKAIGYQFDEGTYHKLVKRVYDIAGCNPHLKIYLNGKQLKLESFKDYIKLYTEQFELDEQDNWQVGVAASEDGFQHISFVNTSETTNGGTHIEYVSDQLITKLREHFKLKHKIDVKPADIRQHMLLFINAKIVRPRYTSQTKENLMTEPRDYKTAYKVSEKLINKLLRSSIIQRVLDWVEAKLRAKEMQEIRDKNKDLDKANPKRIIKLADANKAGKEPLRCMLMLTEGDSAKAPICAGRDAATMGVLALRGKPQNANSVTIKKLLGLELEGKKTETEFYNICAAMGLQIGTPVKDLKQLRYAKLVITSDADADGSHVAGLLINNIYKFWPELFALGAIYRFKTPILKAWVKGSTEPIAFETQAEYDTWFTLNKTKLRYVKYYKGLGTSDETEWAEYLADIDKHLVRLSLDKDDGELIKMVFSQDDDSADRRKVWLDLSDDTIDTGANV